MNKKLILRSSALFIALFAISADLPIQAMAASHASNASRNIPKTAGFFTKTYDAIADMPFVKKVDAFSNHDVTKTFLWGAVEIAQKNVMQRASQKFIQSTLAGKQSNVCDELLNPETWLEALKNTPGPLVRDISKKCLLAAVHKACFDKYALHKSVLGRAEVAGTVAEYAFDVVDAWASLSSGKKPLTWKEKGKQLLAIAGSYAPSHFVIKPITQFLCGTFMSFGMPKLVEVAPRLMGACGVLSSAVGFLTGTGGIGSLVKMGVQGVLLSLWNSKSTRLPKKAPVLVGAGNSKPAII